MKHLSKLKKMYPYRIGSNGMYYFELPFLTNDRVRIVVGVSGSKQEEYELTFFDLRCFSAETTTMSNKELANITPEELMSCFSNINIGFSEEHRVKFASYLDFMAEIGTIGQYDNVEMTECVFEDGLFVLQLLEQSGCELDRTYIYLNPNKKRLYSVRKDVVTEMDLDRCLRPYVKNVLINRIIYSDGTFIDRELNQTGFSSVIDVFRCG